MKKDTKEFLNMLIQYHLDDEFINWNEDDIAENGEHAIAMVKCLLQAYKELNVDNKKGYEKMIQTMILESKMKQFGFIKEG